LLGQKKLFFPIVKTYSLIKLMELADLVGRFDGILTTPGDMTESERKALPRNRCNAKKMIGIWIYNALIK
jgi:hypothetical protein